MKRANFDIRIYVIQCKNDLLIEDVNGTRIYRTSTVDATLIH